MFSYLYTTFTSKFSLWWKFIKPEKGLTTTNSNIHGSLFVTHKTKPDNKWNNIHPTTTSNTNIPLLHTRKLLNVKLIDYFLLLCGNFFKKLVFKFQYLQKTGFLIFTEYNIKNRFLNYFTEYYSQVFNWTQATCRFIKICILRVRDLFLIRVESRFGLSSNW